MDKTIFFFKFYPLIMNFIMISILTFLPLNKNFHPINSLLILILLTLFISLKMNFLLNSITSFILFLIMIGGMLIIFLYITSLSSNEIFTFNLNNIMSNIVKMLMIFITFIFTNMKFNILNTNFYLYKYNFFEMYTITYNNNIIFIMNYLFYAMICIMYICYKFKLPLRQLKF